MAIEHTLSATDTLESLAARYLGDSTRWMEIAEYNRLTYPYIVEDASALDEFRASGFVRVIRNQFENNLVILPGSRFRTRASLHSGVTKEYVSVDTTVIPAGEVEGYVFVRCQVPGSFGNVLEGSIVVAHEIITPSGRYSSALTVTNDERFSNGQDVRVLAAGDSILIPTEVQDEVQQAVGAQSYLNLLAGEDLALDDDGFLNADSFGDLASVSGLDNIVQAITHRLTTDKGTYPHNPEYGTNLSDLIGRPQTSYLDRLVELDIYESLSYEDRIDQVSINMIRRIGTRIELDLTFRIINTEPLERVQLSLDFSQRE